MYSVAVTIETRDPFSNDTFSFTKGTLAISETKPMVQFCICIFAENNKIPLCVVDLTPGFRFTMKSHKNQWEGSFYFGQQIWATIFESGPEADAFLLYLTIARFFSSFCDDIIFQDVSCISYNTQNRATVGDQLEIQFDVWQVPTNQLKAACGDRLGVNTIGNIELVEGHSNGLNKGLIGMPHGGSRIIIIPPHQIHKGPLGLPHSHITMPVAVFVRKMSLKRPTKRIPIYQLLQEAERSAAPNDDNATGDNLKSPPFSPFEDENELSDEFDDGYTYRLLMMELEDIQQERDKLQLQIMSLKTQAQTQAEELTESNQRYAALLSDYQKANGETVSSMSVIDLDKLEEHLGSVLRKVQFEKERKKNINSLEPDCTVCMDKKSTSVCVPCGHYCLCDCCSVEINKHSVIARCPICRQIIQQVVKVFK